MNRCFILPIKSSEFDRSTVFYLASFMWVQLCSIAEPNPNSIHELSPIVEYV